MSPESSQITELIRALSRTVQESEKFRAALLEYRDIAKDAIPMLLYLGRDELLMADRLHRLDTTVRQLLHGH